MTLRSLPNIQYLQGQPIRLGTELGRGGEGAVTLIQGHDDLVAKIYLEPPTPAQIQKLQALVSVRTPELDAVSAWPSDLIQSQNGEVGGFAMPLVKLEEYREIHSLYTLSSRRKYFAGADWSFLVLVARNVARTFASLHGAGHLMGDVSSRNILVSAEGAIRLIDTDSFQVRVGNRVFLCPVGTAEFTPPELQGQALATCCAMKTMTALALP